MNNDTLDHSVSTLLEALPFVMTAVDRDVRVMHQFNADDTPLFTPRGEIFLDSTPETVALIREALQTATSVHFETQHLPQADNIKWFEHDLVFAPGSSAMVVSRDITERKAAEAEHTRIKRRYDAIVQNISDAITISTWGTSYDDNVLLEVNQRTVDLLGYSFDELRAMRPSDILSEEYKPQAYRKRALRENRQLTEIPMQFPVRRKDGSIGYVESLAFLVEDENRRIVETIALVRDVTERIEREEQLRQAKLAAEAALSACDVFVAHMGENLRQLLCDILEDTRLMLGRAGTSADLLERLNRIHNQTEHLYDQIGDILDLAHVEAGFDAVELSVFNLPHLLRRLEETLHLPAQQQGITLRFEGIDDLPILIRSDETKLKRILVNVIGDALKGTERGSVSVRALCLPDHVLRFEIAEPCKRGEHSAAGEASPYQSLGIDISARLVDVLCGQLEIVQTAEGVMITIVLPYVAVRDGSPSSDMPALPSQEQLGQLSEAWLQKMYAYCIAGQVEQAHAHVKALDPAQLDTAVQLSALIMLFHLDRIADAIEPLIDAE